MNPTNLKITWRAPIWNRPKMRFMHLCRQQLMQQVDPAPPHAIAQTLDSTNTLNKLESNRPVRHSAVISECRRWNAKPYSTSN